MGGSFSLVALAYPEVRNRRGGYIFQAIDNLSDPRWSEAGPPSPDKTTCALINSRHHLIWMNTTVIGSLTVISSAVTQDFLELITTDRQQDVQEYIRSWVPVNLRFRESRQTI